MKKLFLVSLWLLILASCNQASLQHTENPGISQPPPRIQEQNIPQPDWDAIKFPHEDEARVDVSAILTGSIHATTESRDGILIIKPLVRNLSAKIAPKVFFRVGVGSYISRGYFEIGANYTIPPNTKANFLIEYNSASGVEVYTLDTLTRWRAYADDRIDPNFWEGMNHQKLTTPILGSDVFFDNSGNTSSVDLSHTIYDTTWTGTHLPKKVVFDLSAIRDTWDFSTGSVSIDFGLWPLEAMEPLRITADMTEVERLQKEQDFSKKRSEWIHTLKFSYRDIDGKKHEIVGDRSFITNTSPTTVPRDIFWGCFHSCTAEITNMDILSRIQSIEIEYAPTDFGKIAMNPPELLWTIFPEPKTSAEKQGTFVLPKTAFKLPMIPLEQDVLTVVPMIDAPTPNTKVADLLIDLSKNEEKQLGLMASIHSLGGSDDMTVSLFHNSDQTGAFLRATIDTQGRATVLGKVKHLPGGVDSTDLYRAFVVREDGWSHFQVFIPQNKRLWEGEKIGTNINYSVNRPIWNLLHPPKKIIIDISQIAPYMSGTVILPIDNFSGEKDWNPKLVYTDSYGNRHEITQSERPNFSSQEEFEKQYYEYIEHRPKIYFQKNTHRGYPRENVEITVSMPYITTIRTIEVSY